MTSSEMQTNRKGTLPEKRCMVTVADNKKFRNSELGTRGAF